MQKPVKNKDLARSDGQPPNEGSTPAFVRVAECLWRNSTTDKYYAFLKRDGKQYHRSLKTTDRQLAERRLAKLRAKVERLKPANVDGNLLFREMADRWFKGVKVGMKESSAKRREVSINQLTPYFKTKSIRAITRADCDEWMIRRGSKISSSSFNNERDTLVSIFALAERDGLILENPATHLQRRKQEKAELLVPTRTQFRTLVEGVRANGPLAQEGANLIELLACSGMRLAEATSLTWGDIDFDRGCFTVTGGEQGTKNLEARTVPLFPAMRELLVRLKGNQALPRTAKVVNVLSAKRTIESVCRRKDLPAFHHHSLRHYFVSNAIEAGVDFKVIANWVGHKDGGVLVARTYGHLRDTHSFEMAKKMIFSAVGEEGAKTKISVVE